MVARIRLFIGLSFVLAAVGCADDKLVGTRKENQAPQVWLSSAPPEGSVSDYRIHLYWGGWDPDGEIAHYQYAITDNERGYFDPADTTGADKWRKVFANDSTFTFSADRLADSTNADTGMLTPVDFIRSHTFFIRAVDREGLASERPAYRSFTARTLSPTVDILVPRRVGLDAAQISPNSRFSWIGRDYISNEQQTQDPDSVRWIIVPIRNFGNNWDRTIEYVRRNPRAPEWSGWIYYRAPGDSGRACTPKTLDFGGYIFGVQVKDEAGAVSPVFDEARNLRRVSVTPRLTGPILTVSNRYMGSVITASPNTPLVIIDMPAGIPMGFRFTANAAVYGGVASGYRWGWDIQDLSNPTQWETDYTPFVRESDGVPVAEVPSRTWYFDSHTFHVEVMDNSGYTSRMGVTVNIIPFSMRKNLLVVDDYREAGNAGFAITNGTVPSSKEHDDFWLEMVRDVDDFDPLVDMIDVERDLPIQVIADYKSVIWCAYAGYNAVAGLSLLSEIIRFIPDDPSYGRDTAGKVRVNILALFMAAGGHVLLCGEQPTTAVINRSLFAGGTRSPVFPLIFRYELTGDQTTPYDDSDIGVKGVGEGSFTYSECCLNVLDISVITSPTMIRTPRNSTCPVNVVRDHNGRRDGLRFTIPIEDPERFPALELRPEVAGPGKAYAPEARGLVAEIYNPPYFETLCSGIAETSPQRDCFQPIYGHGCLNESSAIYGAPVAFWTRTFANRVPDTAGGVAARSAVWGFAPVFFNPSQVKPAIDTIVFEEWKLPKKNP